MFLDKVGGRRELEGGGREGFPVPGGGGGEGLGVGETRGAEGEDLEAETEL